MNARNIHVNSPLRHRELVKKHARPILDVNELGRKKKRSPPFERIGHPPSLASSSVPVVANPTLPQTSAVGPPQTNNPAPTTPETTAPRANPTPTRSHPAPPPPPAPSSQTLAPTATIDNPSPTTPTPSIESIVPTTVASQPTVLPVTPSSFTPTVVDVTDSDFPTTFSSPTYSIPPLSTDPSVASQSSIPSSSPVASSSLGTGSVIGIVAASLVGVAVVITVAMWLTKRHFKKRDDAEFNRNSFIRQSVHVDDEPYYNQPRPPSMIERHYGATGVGAFAAYGQQPSYGHNDIMPPVPQAHHQHQQQYAQDPFVSPTDEMPMDHNHSHSHNGSYHDPAHNFGQQVDEYGHGNGQGQYAHLERQGSPNQYGQGQYAEISRQLNILPVQPERVMSPPDMNGRVMSPNGGRVTSPQQHTRTLTPPQQQQQIVMQQHHPYAQPPQEDEIARHSYERNRAGAVSPDMSIKASAFPMPTGFMPAAMSAGHGVALPPASLIPGPAGSGSGHHQQGVRPVSAAYDDSDAYGGI